MGFILSDNGGGDYQLIPEATYIATCVLMADIGTHVEIFQGQDPKTVEKLYIGWELNACDDQGKPYTIGTTYNCSLNQKSSLRKMLEAWRGRAFTDEELRNFDIRNVLGKSCGLGVIHKPSNTDPSVKYPRIGSIQALPAGVPPYQPLATPSLFDINQFDQAAYERLPNLAKVMLQKSGEWKILSEQGVVTTADLVADDSDIPF